ncbi:MAG: hypothetical protein KJ043_19850, partial [Anaerolineae bacterium]|nr:hypothetical protein [Anaerolineae bacterium]
MKRVLRLTAVLFGIGLIGMTGMLETTRHSHEADPVLLVADGISNMLGFEALYLMGASSDIQQRISSPTYNFQILRRWQDDKWLYLSANRNSEEFNNGSGVIWQIQRDNHCAKPLSYASIVTRVVTTPDGKWLVYIAYERNGRAHLFRLQTVEGAQPFDLLHDVESLPIASTEMEVSKNGQWVYFNVRQDDDSDVYRVSIDGGVPENLTSEIEGRVFFIAEGNDWLLFRSEKMAYLTSLDGSEQRPLFPSWAAIEEVGSIFWWEEQNLVIVAAMLQERYYLWAFEMPNAALIWRYEGLSPLGSPSSLGSLITSSDDGFFYHGSDGRQTPRIIQGGVGQMGFYSDGTITYLKNFYTDDHTITDFFELWRFLPDGTTQMVYAPVTRDVGLNGSSWDRRWMALYDYDTNSNQPHNIILNTEDGKIYR